MLLDAGSDGEWAAAQFRDVQLAAPGLVDFETANILRRCELASQVSADQAALAHADLLDLSIERWPYDVLAERVWQLRANLSSYDASYVAVAELIDAPLVTLDRRISRASGPRCVVLTP